MYQKDSILFSRAGEVLERWYGFRPKDMSIVVSGRVNRTIRVEKEDGSLWAFQCLNPFFGTDPSFGENWHLVESSLDIAGIKCPRLVPDILGQWIADYEKDELWRLSSWLPGGLPPFGKTGAASAAALLGHCHRALNSPKPIELKPLPEIGEFTNQHLCLPEDFDEISLNYRRHPLLDGLRPSLARAREAALALPGRPSYQRIFMIKDLVIHGDPKRDNFLFEQDEAIAMIDWDTAGYGDPLIDLGELCRSFAVRATPPLFDAEIASAALKAYLKNGLALNSEQASFIPAIVRGLALNLARRYLIDALAEVYFKWDEKNYISLSVQNHSRAQVLLDLVEELLDREMELRDI